MSFFRHEYGAIVAVLTCRVGTRHVEAVEDAVQSALLAALDSWTRGGLPANPSAWPFRVAQNRLFDEMRTDARRQRILLRVAGETAALTPGITEARAEAPAEAEIRDDLLRMLFACCDPVLPAGSQLVLALKTLCGFDVREIEVRLFASEANVYKRLHRARIRLRALPGRLGDLPAEEYSRRLAGVQQVLYLLFTEGHLA